MQDHIDHARRNLNFSVWTDYSQEDKNDLLEELAEEVEEEGMPLESYTWAHSEARLTDQQREALVNWAKNQLASQIKSAAESSSTESENID